MTDIDPAVQVHIAAANAAEAGGNHAARAAAATAALAAWSTVAHPTPPAEPKDAVAASARLAHLNKDPAWRSRFGAGDIHARREFESLNQLIASADPVELALAGVAPADSVDENMGAAPSGRDLVRGVTHLRELGFNDDNTREILSGQLMDDNRKPLDAAAAASLAAEAERAIARATKDSEFRKKLLSGDQDAKRAFDRACAIIAVGRK